MNNLVELIKKAALDAFENKKPTEIKYGVVENISPVNIRINQKILLTKNHLIETETFRNKEIHIGDKVILIRVQGGQKFVVLDRM